MILNYSQVLKCFTQIEQGLTVQQIGACLCA